MLSQSSRPYLDKTRLSCLTSLVLAVKTIRQKHQVSPELLRLLDEFRRMVNVCIAVGIEENVSSLKTLSLRSYHRRSSESSISHNDNPSDEDLTEPLNRNLLGHGLRVFGLGR